MLCPLGAGLFFAPTVFTDVEDDMMIAQEESFGPVMIISKFIDGWDVSSALTVVVVLIGVFNYLQLFYKSAEPLI